MKMYYCPRGCNAFETHWDDPECAACGCRMSLDDTAFYDAIERIEEEGIARVDEQLELPFKPANDR